MDKKIAEEMIELAIKQLDFSYVPYSGFKVGAALRTKMDNITQAVILKMPLTHRQTVQKEQHSLRRSVKA